MTAAPPLIALVGNPNAGKSALFNALTGARQKIANYPGVTVERKSGRLFLPDGRPAELLDLPGTYSLVADSLDEQVTRDVVLGQREGERAPDLLVVVVDAANLENHLRFTLELIALGRPIVVALNMLDLAERDGLTIDAAALQCELGVPVVSTVAVRRRGLDELKATVEIVLQASGKAPPLNAPSDNRSAFSARAKTIAAAAITSEREVTNWTQKLDAVLLHPVGGLAILLGLLFVIFQAVFSWSEAPIGWVEGAQEWLAGLASAALPDGLFRSLIVDGIIGGVGSVVVFLPQILILFFFILVLEQSGYMTRAAFLMDKLMASVGLSGHSFIPLLSSFACAIPGIMATRSIMDQKERLTTILIAPLMTCSARLPVYTVIIGAFIPAQTVGGVGLQGLVLFTLYLGGIVGAMLASFAIRGFVVKGGTSSFMLEMPKYQVPRLPDLMLGLWQRAVVFLKRAGGIIFIASVVLWALLTFPQKPVASPLSQTEYSIAGRIADVLEPVVRPIGFNRDIALAIIPAMAAREVAVAALATVNAIDADGDEDKVAQSLGEKLAGEWSLATALAFLAWFVFAPQCISTIAVAKRETNGWKWPIFMVTYLFALAYAAAGITYWTATAFGL
jgi:ferrous iron transport protein B